MYYHISTQLIASKNKDVNELSLKSYHHDIAHYQESINNQTHNSI